MSLEAFTKALVAFQQELPHVGKDNKAQIGGSHSYTYADLTAIHSAAFPLLAKHGLAWVTRPTLIDGDFVLAYSLLHEDGWSEDGCYPLPDPVKSTPQQLGSAITYARRYCFNAVTGIAPGGEDDDGAKASEARSQPRQQAPKPSGKPPLLVAKERVWSIAQALGWDKADIGLNYAKDHEGETVETATVEQLNKWAGDLEEDLRSGGAWRGETSSPAYDDIPLDVP